MSFWSEKLVRSARIPHKCIYCRRTIAVGESYYHEAGVWEGDFQHYDICPRCLILAKHFDDGEELGELTTSILDTGMLTCPKCSSINLASHDISGDTMRVDCECENCAEKWVEDISEKGVKDILERL